MSTSNCPACGAPVALNVTECKYCGESIAVNQPQMQAQQNTSGFNSYAQTITTSNVNSPESINKVNEMMKDMNEMMAGMNANNANNMNSNMNNNNMNHMNTMNSNVYVPRKSKTTAGILAILLGGLGVHKFYLGKVGWGIVYLLFCWTYIPALIGFIEGIIYLASSDESFNMKYGRS